MSSLKKKERTQIDDCLKNRDKYHKTIEQQIQMLISDKMLPEPMYYLMIMEVCFKKIASNVNKETYFDTIEASANEIMYEQEQPNWHIGWQMLY